MRFKNTPLVIIVTVFVLAGWQIYRLAEGRGKAGMTDPEVLAATTTKTLEERVASLESRVYTLERSVGLIKPSSTGKIKEQFVQLTAGKASGADWVKIPNSDFTFDAALWGSSVEVSWQGWIDNGKGSVRIYDDTNHRSVDFSEMSVDSGVKSSFYSKPISIWRGQNQYHLEAKNPDGDISVSSVRLRVVTR